MADENQQKLEKLAKEIDAYKVEFAKEVKKRWDRRTPVRTGRLLKGNEVVINEAAKEIQALNGVPYFDFVENGTPRMAPVGMLKTTVAETQQISDLAWKRVHKK